MIPRKSLDMNEDIHVIHPISIWPAELERLNLVLPRSSHHHSRIVRGSRITCPYSRRESTTQPLNDRTAGITLSLYIWSGSASLGFSGRCTRNPTTEKIVIL
jgi:hypothetical protein